MTVDGFGGLFHPALPLHPLFFRSTMHICTVKIHAMLAPLRPEVNAASVAFCCGHQCVTVRMRTEFNNFPTQANPVCIAHRSRFASNSWLLTVLDFDLHFEATLFGKLMWTIMAVVEEPSRWVGKIYKCTYCTRADRVLAVSVDAISCW